jgi:hypothetical protein
MYYRRALLLYLAIITVMSINFLLKLFSSCVFLLNNYLGFVGNNTFFDFPFGGARIFSHSIHQST